ncbi:hypothetical protein [Cellulosilyticum lentocellum]|uniref:Phage coat protein n=1 Tax=Cellulosilyticum lentocellum (strain ATCC 49066 / DSM 5427 / NCIMB 11756 / RHM5) TaxID=642492 RepID=F2JPK6_CELLD|nr:hypothetical protein [Cellulosilyticum lentocellum]ADZ82554.1 hypothetical protein Clole_0821 [Cellulosilyticum lentocellum DSM 5427]
MGVLDGKIFNSTVFEAYKERTPHLRRNELLKSGALVNDDKAKAAMSAQTGTNYSTEHIKGSIEKGTQNYDGGTDITSQRSKTLAQGKVVVGRADAWTEEDFTYDITSGEDFMQNIAEQVGEYWDDVDQDTLISILKGIFNMTGTENVKFVTNHTYDITAEATNNTCDATTLNSATQKAMGDKRKEFAVAIMHSVVVKNLENMKVLDYLKYTDKDGIERSLTIGTLNGRLVLEDDGMPIMKYATTKGAYKIAVGTAGATGEKLGIKFMGKEFEYTVAAADDTATKQATAIAAILNADADITATSTTTNVTISATNALTDVATATPELTIASGATLVATASETTATVTVDAYVSYALGKGAIKYADCGVKVPSEVYRDPSTNGGEDTLYSRQRKMFAPKGISFTNSAIVSPTDAQLENGANWSLAASTDGTVVFPHKAIPIARVISRG